MPKVIGVRFRTSPRMYYFAATDGEQYIKGGKVIVETQRGIELATVVMPETEVTEDKIVAPLKPVLRIATEADLQAVEADETKKQEMIATAKQKVEARGLDMKIVDCEFTVDHSKLVLYFTAESRVDFRELVRDLASAFHMRIDLRQIGSREECKLIGSLGSCGLPCCCGRFESDCEHVSIKMAKNQGLALTPNKINGMCGRLLCCLSYENKTYEDVIRRSPKHGTWVTCPDGCRGTVVSVTPLTEKVRVRVGDDDNFEFCDFDLNDIKFERKEQKSGGQDDAIEETPKNTQNKAEQKNHNGNNNRNGKNKNNNNNGNSNTRDNDNNAGIADVNTGGNGNGNNNEKGKNKNHRRKKKHGGKPQQQ